jgi:hypothetical protein
VQSQIQRGLAGDDDVDDYCGALELRLTHYLDHRYNRQPHESLGGQTPLARFEADIRAPHDVRPPDPERKGLHKREQASRTGRPQFRVARAPLLEQQRIVGR